MTREEQVVAVMRKNKWVPMKPSVLTRYMNLESPCDWCPVLPPKPKEKCAVVPKSSRLKVGAALLGLAKKGVVVDLKVHRHPSYVLTEMLKEMK